MVDGDGVGGEGVVLMVFDIIAIQKGKEYVSLVVVVISKKDLCAQFHNIIPNSNTRVVSLRCLQDKSDLYGQFNNMILENKHNT